MASFDESDSPYHGCVEDDVRHETCAWTGGMNTGNDGDEKWKQLNRYCTNYRSI